jgi:LysM repeat protein
MNANDTIVSYRKRRQQLLPLILGIAAFLLVVIGIIIVVTSLSGGGGGLSLFATQTPTPTITSSPTNTSTPTQTPPTTSTGTPSAIYPYVVKEGDYLSSIITAQGLSNNPNALIIIFILNPTIDPNTGLITVGQTILLPPPGLAIPTMTPIPTGLANGSRIIYRIMPGDSLGGIASQFNSTIADIVKLNTTERNPFPQWGVLAHLSWPTAGGANQPGHSGADHPGNQPTANPHCCGDTINRNPAPGL